MGETPREIGARIFRENAQSKFGDKEWVMSCLKKAAEAAAQEVFDGFFQAEMNSRILMKIPPITFDAGPPPPRNRKERRSGGRKV